MVLSYRGVGFGGSLYLTSPRSTLSFRFTPTHKIARGVDQIGNAGESASPGIVALILGACGLPDAWMSPPYPNGCSAAEGRCPPSLAVAWLRSRNSRTLLVMGLMAVAATRLRSGWQRP